MKPIKINSKKKKIEMLFPVEKMTDIQVTSGQERTEIVNSLFQKE